MNRFLLDTSALICLRDDEPGADRVAQLLTQSDNDEVRCFGCFISRMEVLYRVWKDEGENEGRLAYEQIQALPIAWVHESKPLLEKAAAIKACYPLSLADAWIAASAILKQATLIHKDPEFRALDVVDQELLPLKSTTGR